MTTGRAETFADGVLAIAATLLILNVGSNLPAATHPTHGLGNLLIKSWPTFAAYGISFFTIGIIWVNHHALMNQIARVDRTFLFITVFFLMTVSFIPFPTRLIADNLLKGEGRVAAVTYGFTLTATAVAFNAMWLYAIRGRRLLREDADPAVVKGITRSYLTGPWVYLLATAVAIGSPGVSLLMFAAFNLFWVLESSLFGRDKEPAAESSGEADEA
jgi:TMEM175 potassium channel family protein